MLKPLEYCPKCNSILKTSTFVFYQPTRYFYCSGCNDVYKRTENLGIEKVLEEDMTANLLGWINSINKFEFSQTIKNTTYSYSNFSENLESLFKRTIRPPEKLHILKTPNRIHIL